MRYALIVAAAFFGAALLLAAAYFVPMAIFAVLIPGEDVAPVQFGGTTALDCTAAGTRDIYDTPSGTVEAGYYDPASRIGTLTDATSGQPNTRATVIGKKYFELCTDAQRKQYEYEVTRQQYDDFQVSTPLPTRTI